MEVQSHVQRTEDRLAEKESGAPGELLLRSTTGPGCCSRRNRKQKALTAGEASLPRVKWCVPENARCIHCRL